MPPPSAPRRKAPSFAAGSAAGRQLDDVLGRTEPQGGVLQAIDTPLLKQLCECWSDLTATAALPEDANTIRLRVSLRRQYCEIAARFGMSPLDRQKILVDPPADENPFITFMQEQQGLA